LKAAVLKEAIGKAADISGLAAGPDGTLYVASERSVFTVRPDGTVAKLAGPVEIEGCTPGRPDNDRPHLRGLAVDPKGAVYVAATGCQCVVKLTADGKVETVLKAERPWSPTGVAVAGDAVYVLEHTHAQLHPVMTPDGEGWRPRDRPSFRNVPVSGMRARKGDLTIRLQRWDNSIGSRRRVFRYGLAELEIKKLSDGEAPSCPLAEWAARHRFIAPGTHDPFTGVHYAEQAAHDETVP
jgi:hypothetical protein